MTVDREECDIDGLCWRVVLRVRMPVVITMTMMMMMAVGLVMKGDWLAKVMG